MCLFLGIIYGCHCYRDPVDKREQSHNLVCTMITPLRINNAFNANSNEITLKALPPPLKNTIEKDLNFYFEEPHILDFDLEFITSAFHWNIL